MRHLTGLALFFFVVAVAITGCAGNRGNPPATQPATAIDLATTQPSYWLSQPAAAVVQAKDFDRLWEACKSVARSYLFAIDREDFRAGLITTDPMVSKQMWEIWRSDTGSFSDVMENSTATIRRTLRFEIARDEAASFTITPKVLIERLAVLERRITSVAQYRTAFAGPAAPARYAVARDVDPTLDLPARYWYPIGRDTKMEQQVAARLRGRLERGPAGRPGDGGGGKKLEFDGAIMSPGPNDLVYIDLGAQHGIVPGMTFEVYDARASLPPLEHFGSDNPGSKGWIEVVRADQSSSAARVIAPDAAAKPGPGDRVFNFIYDRRTPVHFVLAGEFAGGRDTVAGLIRQWRGVVDERVGEGTNYLILGQAPAEDEGKRAYRETKTAAEELGVTIVDEARFNLLVRYPAQPK
jgi:hypothetical protein